MKLSCLREPEDGEGWLRGLESILILIPPAGEFDHPHVLIREPRGNDLPPLSHARGQADGGDEESGYPVRRGGAASEIRARPWRDPVGRNQSFSGTRYLLLPEETGPGVSAAGLYEHDAQASRLASATIELPPKKDATAAQLAGGR